MKIRKCRQCGAAVESGKTCTDRLYQSLFDNPSIDRQQQLEAAARFALSHSRSFSQKCLDFARGLLCWRGVVADRGPVAAVCETRQTVAGWHGLPLRRRKPRGASDLS